MVDASKMDENPAPSVELTEAQPGQPVEAPEAPTELPEGAELEAMGDAGELGVVEEATEGKDGKVDAEGAEIVETDAPQKKRGRKRAEPKAEKPEEKVDEEETSPHEPDESSEDEADLTVPEGDIPGIVTKLSKDKFKKLTSAWLGNGKPNTLTAFGVMWLVVDDGAKFVSKGAPGAMGDYGSLSTGYAKG